MESKSRIGSVLIICGTVCMVAMVAYNGLFAYLLYLEHNLNPGGEWGVGKHRFAEYMYTFSAAVLVGFAGLIFVVIGMVIGRRESRESSKTPSPPH